MAARQVLKQISSTMFQNQLYSPYIKDPSLRSVTPFITSGFFNLNSQNKGIQTTAPQIPNQDAAEETKKEKKSDTSFELDQSGGGTTDSSSVKYSAVSNLKTSSRHDLAMVFTCKVCETRSVKTACHESYEKGIVVARCDGCNNLHLMADRLGWFGEKASVEDFLAARGEEVKKGSTKTLNLTLEDLAGTKSNG